MSNKQFYAVRVGVAPGADIEEVRNAINRIGGAITLNVEHEGVADEDETCGETRCDRPATATVHFPGHGEIDYCEDHAQQAFALASELGMGLGIDND